MDEQIEPGSDATPTALGRPSGGAVRRLVWLILLLLVGGGLLFLYSGHEKAQTATKAGPAPSPAPVAVETAAARKGSIGVYVNALGTVTPLSTVTVKARVDGQLMRVNYREGEMVREGDLLAEIDPRPFQAQLTQAEGQYERDKAILENARVDLERYRLAYSKNAIPKQQLDTQEATVRQYEGIVKNDQGQIDSVKLQLAYCRLTSPTSGRVGLRLVDPGNIVQTGDANGMLVITQMQPITVVFSVAEANAQIGVAKAALYPSLTLGAAGGFSASSVASWLTWPARFWSVGPALAQTLFDKGRRKAITEQARAQYDATVAAYRQTVLTAFQEVEDNLAALRILPREVEQQEVAVKAAERSLALATERYKAGIDPYLNVITAQTTLLTNEQAALNLRMQQMTTSVQLIKALGGGWNASELPTPKQLLAKPPQDSKQPKPTP